MEAEHKKKPTNDASFHKNSLTKNGSGCFKAATSPGSNVIHTGICPQSIRDRHIGSIVQPDGGALAQKKQRRSERSEPHLSCA